MPADKGQDGSIIGSAETFISYMGGNRSFPVAGNIDDRRHRLKNLDPGDSAMYRTKDDYQQFHMTTDGGFWSAPQDKTVRLALIDQNSGQQQQQGQQQGGQQQSSGQAG
jgi:phage gp45-like